jgi:hypothetical protein
MFSLLPTLCAIQTTGVRQVYPINTNEMFLGNRRKRCGHCLATVDWWLPVFVSFYDFQVSLKRITLRLSGSPTQLPIKATLWRVRSKRLFCAPTDALKSVSYSFSDAPEFY